jgi:hypothetical protein
MMKNPFLSFWLSVTNQWLSAGRGFWMAELHRQQAAMLNEMTRNAIEFWSGGWMVPAKSKRRR